MNKNKNVTLKDFLNNLGYVDDVEEIDLHWMEELEEDDEDEDFFGDLHSYSKGEKIPDKKFFLNLPKEYNDEEVLEMMVDDHIWTQSKFSLEETSVLMMMSLMTGLNHPQSLAFLSQQTQNFHLDDRMNHSLVETLNALDEKNLQHNLKILFSNSSTLSPLKMIVSVLKMERAHMLRSDRCGMNIRHSIMNVLFDQAMGRPKEAQIMSETLRDFFKQVDFIYPWGMKWVYDINKKMGQNFIDIDEKILHRSLLEYSFCNDDSLMIEGSRVWFDEMFAQIPDKGRKIFDHYTSRPNMMGREKAVERLNDEELMDFMSAQLEQVSPSVAQRGRALMEKGLLRQRLGTQKKM